MIQSTAATLSCLCPEMNRSLVWAEVKKKPHVPFGFLVTSSWWLVTGLPASLMPGAELTVCAKPVSTMFMSPVNTQCLRHRAVAHSPSFCRVRELGLSAAALWETRVQGSATMQAREAVGYRGSGRRWEGDALGPFWKSSGHCKRSHCGV